jgi:hypothetical protein
MKNIWTLEDVTDVDWTQAEPDRSFFEVGWHKTLFPNWLSLTCAALTE